MRRNTRAELDRTQQRNADQRSEQGAASAGDRDAADHDGGNHLQFEAFAGLGIDEDNRTALSRAARPVSAADEDEDQKMTRVGRMPARRAASSSDPTA